MTDPRPLLLVVCGPPASGKSTLARRLGAELFLPVLIRDDIKAGLAETRGSTSWTDLTKRRQLSDDGFALLHALSLQVLRAECGIVLEAAYHWPIARHEFAPHRAVCRMVVIECRAEPDLLRDRYARRFARGERHPCHSDAEYIELMHSDEYDWTFYDVPGDVAAPVITIDTTNGYDPDLPTIKQKIGYGPGL